MSEVVDFFSGHTITPVVSGMLSVRVTDTLRELLGACAFDNVDSRLKQVVFGEGTPEYQSNWGAIALRDAFASADDILTAVERAPRQFMGARQLLVWEARYYNKREPMNLHRVVALGASVVEGGELKYLTINHNREGLVTLGFSPLHVLMRLPETYFLRVW